MQANFPPAIAEMRVRVHVCLDATCHFGNGNLSKQVHKLSSSSVPQKYVDCVLNEVGSIGNKRMTGDEAAAENQRRLSGLVT